MNANLARLSTVMGWLATAGFLVQPLGVIACYLMPQGWGPWFTLDAHLGTSLVGVPLFYRLAALPFGLVSTGFTMWALWSLRQLFFHYARGEVFTYEPLRRLNHVAIALFASVVVGFAMNVPVSFLLSLPRGPGRFEISLSFGSGEIANLFMAGVVLVIARVMAEARRLADENAKFI